MAQKLMAEYHISMSEVEETNDMDDVIKKYIIVGTGNKWKYILARIISKNFRCKYMLQGNSVIIFYGHKIDAEIAAKTFDFLFETGNKAATKFYNKKRSEAAKYGRYFNGTGIKNSFLIGFVEGISEVLEKQCTALMITIPQEVENGFTEITRECKKVTHNFTVKSCYADESRSEGNKAGKDAINSRQLKATE